MGERGRERIRRAYEWISSYAAGAVRLKLRSDFTYRTPRPYTYVCPRGEIRKKREKERPECFHFRSGLIKRCAYMRYVRPIVTSPRYDRGPIPSAYVRSCCHPLLSGCVQSIRKL